MVLLIGGGLALAVIQLARSEEVGAQYVLAETVEPEGVSGWTIFRNVPQSAKGESGVSLSIPRSVGVWIGAFLTLAVFSFLAGDNPAYKLAESIFVGVSAGYVMVAAFWDQIIQNLVAKILPHASHAMGIANLDGKIEHPQSMFLIPLVMSGMMLWQLFPKGGWIARWPLAFFIGATAGIRMTATFEADFVRQIQQTLLPIVAVVYDNAASGRSVDWVASLQQSVRNTVIVFGVLSSLTYFFFSVEHRGPVQVASRIGIFVLMITFGAAFGFTVMGRIVLLTQRLEFLFFDWLRFPLPT
jgi:hypothetical protein